MGDDSRGRLAREVKGIEGTGSGRREVEQAVSRWVEAYGDRLVRYAQVLVEDREEAQDIVQEVFLRLYRWQCHHPARTVEPAFLYRIVKHLAIDRLRERTRRERLAKAAAVRVPGVDWESPAVDRLDLAAILEGMSPADRSALWLFYYEGWSSRDIARWLGVTRANVRGRLFRARRRFLEAWRAGEANQPTSGRDER